MIATITNAITRNINIRFLEAILKQIKTLLLNVRSWTIGLCDFNRASSRGLITISIVLHEECRLAKCGTRLSYRFQITYNVKLIGLVMTKAHKRFKVAPL